MGQKNKVYCGSNMCLVQIHNSPNPNQASGVDHVHHIGFGNSGAPHSPSPMHLTCKVLDTFKVVLLNTTGINNAN